MTKVFVYGTLKVGFHNYRLLKTATFLGRAMTRDSFNMIDVGFPVILPPIDVGYPVKGEVYEVDDATIQRLDALENEGRMYQRQTRTVVWLDRARAEEHADMYVGIVSRWDDYGQPVDVIDNHYDWKPDGYEEVSYQDSDD